MARGPPLTPIAMDTSGPTRATRALPTPRTNSDAADSTYFLPANGRPESIFSVAFFHRLGAEPRRIEKILSGSDLSGIFLFNDYLPAKISGIAADETRSAMRLRRTIASSALHSSFSHSRTKLAPRTHTLRTAYYDVSTEPGPRVCETMRNSL